MGLWLEALVLHMDFSTWLLGLPHGMAAGFQDRAFQKQEVGSHHTNSGASPGNGTATLLLYFIHQSSPGLSQNLCGRGLDRGINNEGHSSLRGFQSNTLS